jgi:hypothetical protein
MGFAQLLVEAEKILKSTPYSKADIERLIPEAVTASLLDRRCGRLVWEKNDEFYLLKRAQHVYKEASLVEQFVEV